VGVESLCELLEFDLLNAPSAGEVEKRLSVQLPEGIVPSSLRELSLRDYALSSKIRRVIYRVKLGSGMDPSKLEAMAEAFRASDTFIVRKTLKGKTKEYDLKDLITDLQTETNGFVFSVKSGPEGSIHPFDATAALLNIDREEAKDAGITKIGISLPDSEG
jgi:radical SAM-linked protein